jgi:hypothetical protein
MRARLWDVFAQFEFEFYLEQSLGVLENSFTGFNEGADLIIRSFITLAGFNRGVDLIIRAFIARYLLLDVELPLHRISKVTFFYVPRLH